MMGLPVKPPPPKGSMSMRGRLNLLIGRRRRLIVALALSSVVSGMTEAATLALIAQVAASFVNGKHIVAVHAGPIDIHAGVPTLIKIAFVLTLARLAMQFPLSILPARISSEVQAGMRTRIFHAYTEASWEAQSSDREGQLQETITSQVMQATGAAMQMTALVTSLFTFLVMLTAAFVLNSVAALAVLAVSLLGFGLLRPLRLLGIRRSRALSKAQIHFARGVAESVRLAEETQVYGVGAALRERIDVYIGRSKRLFYRAQMLAKLTGNLYQSLIYILLVIGLWGLYLAGRGHAGSLGAIVLVLMRASSSGQGVQAAYQGLSQSLPFIERTQNLERRFSESRRTDGGRPLPPIGTLAFSEVGFSYRPAEPVLSEISFEVAASEAIGIVGPSGAGKSTLVQLLLRLRVPREGVFLVNGDPAEEFARADWSRRVAYVPQEPRLLHASVSDNIRYFRDIDDESVERAARLARIHDDIVSWPKGYDTIVGPRADAVSGGQKQRICLARALAASPEVLVLDEPTSALDPHSETQISASLTSLKHELTLFIVAHRMSTLDMCDRVMVIVDGRLVAFDTKALLETENAYYRSASAIAAGTSERGLS
jgi:ATP-binding cassette, subfamily B, bacterial